ncbi:FAD dependent oxidoreductase [Candidatus Koribacter versatilis Ellin345]|uniref:FAD dependent oxidoreductase n=1 Tax=Koribacter versatilis (strain Ellin345) TaxID=204669 RepID=Q1IIF5_KORVE|nr:FAD-dependent oxidoreductase [Candidatus Koribacter versatilis]ABF43345.1 FAD dependent oxidoreductase [Candidatus Koribacter versatilis Ellin345]
MTARYDVAVIGAGVFGAWTAHALRQSGKRVVVVDAYGPANSRASSGGETRITRMAYGDDEIYSRWAFESLPEWRALEQRSGRQLFFETGVLTFSDANTNWVQKSVEVIHKIGGEAELLSHDECRHRYPQIGFKPSEIAVFEPRSGALLARHAINLLVEELIRNGCEYRQQSISSPEDAFRLNAEQYVFACGAWLPKLFPDILGPHITPIRAEIFFLGVPPNTPAFDPPQMPTWIFMGNENWDAYGMPSLENRGFKLAVDLIKQPADPDTMDRQPTAPYVAQMREFVRERFPLLADAPIVETRVCQYENTPTHHYLVDHHPRWENIWLVGGGSGHGFKNGPALGKYVADAITKHAPLEPLLRLP